MSRIRTLKPEFFRSRSLSRVSLAARITFQGLWCEADDHGHGIADARLIKGAVWPLDDDIGHEEVEKHLLELEETDHILLYEIGGERYYEVKSWEKNQAAAYRRGEPIHPDPPLPITHEESCKEMNVDTTKVLEHGTGSVSQQDASRTRAHRIPDTFVVTAEMEAWVERECPGLDWNRHTKRFVNHWKSTNKNALKTDWTRAWENWLLKELP